MIHPVYPKEVELATIALRYARDVPIGRSHEQHIETVWCNFCYSFYSKEDLIAKLSMRKTSSR